jgi:hypothetical protein
MCPTLGEEEYVFVSTASRALDELQIQPIMTFREKEGLTCIVTAEEARRAAGRACFRAG